MPFPTYLAATEPLVLALAAVAAVGAAASAWFLLGVLRAVRAASDTAERQAEHVEALREHLRRLESDRAELDLRRTEHVLIDIRDELRGLGDAVLGAVARPAAETAEPVERPDPVDALLERLHNRLTALGYDRVQVVGERELVEMGTTARTEIPLEARRAGVIHKGRCIVDKGRVLDVHMDPPYAMFP